MERTSLALVVVGSAVILGIILWVISSTAPELPARNADLAWADPEFDDDDEGSSGAAGQVDADAAPEPDAQPFEPSALPEPEGDGEQPSELPAADEPEELDETAPVEEERVDEDAGEVDEALVDEAAGGFADEVEPEGEEPTDDESAELVDDDF